MKRASLYAAMAGLAVLATPAPVLRSRDDAPRPGIPGKRARRKKAKASKHARRRNRGKT
jgi:hypothetical protein